MVVVLLRVRFLPLLLLLFLHHSTTTTTTVLVSALSSHSVFIVRHGETNANAAGILQGSLDVSRLTDKGRQQARMVGQFIYNNDNSSRSRMPRRMDRVYVSPLTRARDTLMLLREQQQPAAAASNDDNHIRVVVPTDTTIHPDLREIDLYSWEYQTQTSLLMRYPTEFKAWKRGDPERMIVDGHQPLIELWQRAERVWRELLVLPVPNTQQQQHTNTLLVCHGTLGHALLSTAFGLDAATTFRKCPAMVFGNGALCEIVWDDTTVTTTTTNAPIADRWRWHHPNPTEFADLRDQVVVQQQETTMSSSRWK